MNPQDPARLVIITMRSFFYFSFRHIFISPASAKVQIINRRDVLIFRCYGITYIVFQYEGYVVAVQPIFVYNKYCFA
jgi:hypothetical protein